jgi:lycopene cyclase domain-containing protein
MATYVALNVVFLAVVLAVLKWRRLLVWNRSVIVTLCILIACTAVFDSLIIAAGIVDYDTTKILGIYIGTAPIEDFMYALLAAVVVPALWKGFGLYDRKS